MFLGVYSDTDIANTSGKIGGFPVQRNFLGSIVFPIVILRVFMITRYHTIPTLIAILLSTIAYFVNLFALQQLSYEQKDSGMELFSIPTFYFALILSMAMCFIPEIALKYFRKMTHPTDVDIIKESNRLNKRKL